MKTKEEMSGIKVNQVGRARKISTNKICFLLSFPPTFWLTLFIYCVYVWTSQAELILDNTWMIDVRSLWQAIFGFGDRKSEKSTIANKTQSVYCKYCQWMPDFTPLFLKEKYSWQSHLFVYHFYTYILQRIFNNFKMYFYQSTFLIWRFFIGVLFNKKSPKAE